MFRSYSCIDFMRDLYNLIWVQLFSLLPFIQMLLSLFRATVTSSNFLLSRYLTSSISDPTFFTSFHPSPLFDIVVYSCLVRFDFNRVRTGYGILEKLWNFEKEIPYMEKLWNLSKMAVPMEKLWNFRLGIKKCVFSLKKWGKNTSGLQCLLPRLSLH